MSARTTTRIAAIAALALVLAACARDDAASLVASGRSYLEKGDYAAAAIQFRNARQKAPDNAEVRFLLGRTLLATGDVPGAESDLRRALELKHPVDQVLPPLAQATLALGEHRRVTQEFKPAMVTDPAAKADVAASVAAAYLARGELKEAQASIAEALALQPKNVRALLTKAQVGLRAGDEAGAEAAIDAALAVAPKDPDAIGMKASVLASRGRRDEAIKLLEQAVAADPAPLGPRFALASMKISAGRAGEADSVVASMKKDAPNDVRTRFAEAMLALAKGNAAQARDLVQPLVAARPDHLGFLFLSALANVELKNFAAAEEALRKVSAQAPADPAPRRVLALAYLRAGRYAQAAEVAEDALQRAPDDAALLRLAGEARISLGNVAEAARHYERAAGAEKQGTEARLRLAQIRLATGDSTRALGDLEQLARADGSDIQADLALYAAHLRRREFDQALAAVAAIEKKQPGSALAAELRANAALAQRNFGEARRHFARALEVEPTRLAAARGLAMIDLKEGKIADAKARYEKLIAAAPGNELALVALAELQAFSGAPDAEVRATLDRAIAANPGAAAPHLALIAQLRRVGDTKGAVDAARTAANALPNDAQLLDTLGVLQLQQGETTQARDTFQRLVQMQPSNPGALLRLSEAHAAARDFAAAIEAQRRALALQPENNQALAVLVGTYLIAGRGDEALAEARKLQKDKPKDAVGFLLESEVLLAQKKPAEAVASMTQALARQPNGALAARHYAILTSAGRTAEASAFATRWAKEHPKDVMFQMQLGQYLQGEQNFDGAVNAYRAALAAEPDNAIVLNNLAWLLMERGRPEAREYAERAYLIAPLNPSVIDTLGMVLVKQGDVKRGVEMLRTATRLAPANPLLRVHLARALIASGAKDEAKRELDAAIRTGAGSPAGAEAEKLLREL